MAVIFIGSTDLLSSDRTSRVLVPLLRWFKPDISEETVWRIQIVVRKCGHLTEYAVLAVLLERALRRPKIVGLSPRDRSSTGWALVWAMLCAVSDEAHQAMVSTRFGSAWDVGIDALGAALGLTAVHWRRRAGN